MECQYLGSTPFSFEEEKAKDDSIVLKAQAMKPIEKIRSAELPEGPFILGPGVKILDINKFVTAQQHIQEHVSSKKTVFKAALDRLKCFTKKSNN